MKVLVTGANGQLGYDVMRELLQRGFDSVGCDLTMDCAEFHHYRQLDITDFHSVEKVISDVKPDAIIHCAAWTAVDAAEEEENRDDVYRINVMGTENIARVCRNRACKMMYISTDYVFDGHGTVPWAPDDKCFSPLNYYGKTKLLGELAVSTLLDSYFIVRIAWAFGCNGNNFVKTMLRLADSRSKILVVDDQIGTPTYTPDLARLLVDMIQTNQFGYYHATNEGGFISWYDFASEIFLLARRNVCVIPVSTENYGKTMAKRPENSRLDKSKLQKNGFKPLPDWREALKDYLEHVQKG